MWELLSSQFFSNTIGWQGLSSRQMSALRMGRGAAPLENMLF
jgi:hypothetical protein